MKNGSLFAHDSLAYNRPSMSPGQDIMLHQRILLYLSLPPYAPHPTGFVALYGTPKHQKGYIKLPPLVLLSCE